MSHADAPSVHSRQARLRSGGSKLNSDSETAAAPVEADSRGGSRSGLIGSVRDGSVPVPVSAPQPAPQPESRPGSRAGRRERPRERLGRCGPEALSEAELVALILRTGDRAGDAERLARILLDSVGGLMGLADASGPFLEGVPGLGPAKASSLLASVEIGRRIASIPLERGRAFQGPAQVLDYFRPRLRSLRREVFHTLMLDARHRLLHLEQVSMGTLTASLVHPREVFRGAIRHAAAAVLVIHNHPSGNPAPSAEDRAVTHRLVEAGALLGIRVLDHVIVAEAGHFSFREAGELPEPPAEFMAGAISPRVSEGRADFAAP